VVELDQLSQPTDSCSLEIRFSCAPRILRPHVLDIANHGCIAIARGPLVYGVESVDMPEVADLRALRLPHDLKDIEVQEVKDNTFAALGLKDVVVFQTRGYVLDSAGRSRDIEMTFIPLFLWANRGPADVRVWIPQV
jgi:DUF1680 family protein